ncbi:hypothetical protein BTO09_12775 [Gilvibacter sp. SZ-19]|uniref:DUF6495 family protein n=1 Tax=Gilvibacter sp. SZ-19 TaxID=754429 RepID=UPI000B3BDD60|nr:DUF6495 family protein [Gilvibacter sp. SZ-19]ARV13165.1 hypothetical protein BTO09_12775 [Gilvibacter sp. SZ-19]
MKYTRLTKEQFEALQEEFTRFLATQSITADEWQEIKRSKPEVAEAELDVFSDLVWEGALSAAKYLENASPEQLFCFAVQNELIELIHVKVSPNTADLTTAAGREWLLKNLKDERVVIQRGSKAVSEDRNQQLFGLVRQGAHIVEGSFIDALLKVIN